METNLGKALADAKAAVQTAIDHSDIDLNMWDACTEDGVPASAEERHARLKLALALLVGDMQPTGWSYEIATCVDHTVTPRQYGGWDARISPTRPNVPEGSIRNLKPLYAEAAS